ncbi:MAG TPA: hypothetical protein VK999_05570 [Methylotenera sp.]|nr:hypothetical protein [Methylotenera sp.]
MENAAVGLVRLMPIAMLAIKAALATAARLAIMDAFSERPSEAPSAALALMLADALALSAADALIPTLAAAASDMPGDKDGNPAVMASNLLREARQAQGILKLTELIQF